MFSAVAFATEQEVAKDQVSSALVSSCISEFQALKNGDLKPLCAKMLKLSSCNSVQKREIVHFDKQGIGQNPRRILVFGQIHGDEPDAGLLAFRWVQRLDRLSPQNTWRIVPRVNPDGAKAEQKTRINANGTDINRNFPTKDWNDLALQQWEKLMKKNPRRYPGKSPASEPETQCAVQHIEDFKPEIVVSIHTPYGLLDFDGPKIKFPPFKPLPWIMLGNFPGSLGRYMWVERQVPVLTIELSPTSLHKNSNEFDRFQDLVSLLLDRTSSP
ncbi:MAG: M14 family zinc carboxypeptidase [Pseudobdellovibrionaceae bacterium]